MCLFTFFKQSLVKCLFRSCSLFKNWIVCFLIVEFWEFFYILGISSLLSMWFVNIFFQSVACLFILLIVCLNEDKSQILIKFTLSFFYALCLSNHYCWVGVSSIFNTVILVSFLCTLHLTPVFDDFPLKSFIIFILYLDLWFILNRSLYRPRFILCVWLTIVLTLL